MLIDRRTMMGSGAALAMAGPALAQRGRSDWFDRAIIIDGLGVIRDPYAPDDVTRMSARGV